MVPIFKVLPQYTGKAVPKGGEDELNALMNNKQNPEGIQEVMEEQISELMDQVSFAADAGNEQLVEEAMSEITKAFNKTDRALENNSVEKNKRRIEEPYYINCDLKCITYNRPHTPNLVEVYCTKPTCCPQPGTVFHNYKDSGCNNKVVVRCKMRPQHLRVVTFKREPGNYWYSTTQCRLRAQVYISVDCAKQEGVLPRYVYMLRK